jgi:hypothetical protein
MSLRMRSTIITFSARSFSEAARAAGSVWRGRCPSSGGSPGAAVALEEELGERDRMAPPAWAMKAP